MATFHHPCSEKFCVGFAPARPVHGQGYPPRPAQRHRTLQFAANAKKGRGGWFETYDPAEIEKLRIAVKLGHITEEGRSWDDDGRTLLVTDAETVANVLNRLGAKPVKVDPDLDGAFELPDVLPGFED